MGHSHRSFRPRVRGLATGSENMAHMRLRRTPSQRNGLRMGRHNRLFPVLNYETPDPECPVAAVTDGEHQTGSSFVSLSVTPQGQASAVMVRRME